jgi:hypothetical protein
MSNVLTRFLEDAVLPKLVAEQVFTDPIHRFHKSGDKWRGACPWHKSASGTSFTVNPNSMLWWCQGCHFGGGPVQADELAGPLVLQPPGVLLCRIHDGHGLYRCAVMTATGGDWP